MAHFRRILVMTMRATTANPVVQRELRMTCVDDVDYGGYSSIASDGTAAKTEELEATP